MDRPLVLPAWPWCGHMAKLTIRSLASPCPARRLSWPGNYVSLSFPPLARQLFSWWFVAASLLNLKLYGLTLCTRVTERSRSESRYHSPTTSLCQINATISSCCEGRDNIVDYDHTIRALHEFWLKNGHSRSTLYDDSHDYVKKLCSECITACN